MSMEDWLPEPRIGQAYITDIDEDRFTAVVTWGAVEGADKYRVQAGQHGDPETNVYHVTTTWCEFTYPKHVAPRRRGPAPVKQLCVFVSAEREDGCCGSTSDMATIRVPVKLE